MAKKNKLKKIKPKNQEVTEFDFLICPNCGEQEVGKFCPNCGQSNKDYNKPIKEIVGDLLDSINIDVRLLNTLIPFFTKPGFLAKEYFNGRRKRYVPPMRMYMMVSILFFFLVQYNTDDEIKRNIIQVNDDETSGAMVQGDTSNVFFQMNGITSKDSTRIDSSEEDTIDLLYENLSEEKIQKLKEDVRKDTLETESVKEIWLGSLNAAQKKDLFFDKFLKNVSYVLFLLMPFFALILAMILWKSKMLYVNHLIFSINFHSFIFGLSSVIIVLGEILPESFSEIVLYLWWGIPLYLMLGIKRFYNRKYVGSFFKTIGSLAMYVIIISIVIVIILVITAKGFYEG